MSLIWSMRDRVEVSYKLRTLRRAASCSTTAPTCCNTVEKPPNQLGDAYRCPGSQALEVLNAASR